MPSTTWYVLPAEQLTDSSFTSGGVGYTLPTDGQSSIMYVDAVEYA